MATNMQADLVLCGQDTRTYFWHLFATLRGLLVFLEQHLGLVHRGYIKQESSWRAQGQCKLTGRDVVELDFAGSVWIVGNDWIADNGNRLSVRQKCDVGDFMLAEIDSADDVARGAVDQNDPVAPCRGEIRRYFCRSPAAIPNHSRSSGVNSRGLRASADGGSSGQIRT